MQLLNETYFGKQPDLIEVENLFAAIKQEMQKGKNPNSLNEVKQIEKILGNKFGFETVVLSFLPQEYFMNAFTVPFFHDKKFDEMNFELVRNNNGIKFKNPKNKTLYVYLFNYSIRNYDVESIMSVLLHEIGHNFFLIDEEIKDSKIKFAIDYIIYLFDTLMEYFRNGYDVSFDIFKILLDVSLYIKSPQKYQYNVSTNYGKLLRDKEQKELYNKSLKYDSGIRKFFRRSFKIVTGIISLPLKVVLIGLQHLLKPLFINRGEFRKNIKKEQAYNAERFSDNFAMMYGYAAGIANTFGKDEKSVKDWDFYNKIPVLRVLDYENKMYSQCVYGFTDEHPASIKRVMDAKAKVEYELKNTRLSDVHKKELTDQLERINNIIKTIPNYKKIINKNFSKLIDEKDQIGSDGVSRPDMFDADKTILNKYITNESVTINDISQEDTEWLHENSYSMIESESEIMKNNHKLLENLYLSNEEKLARLSEDQICELLAQTNDYYSMD